MDGSGRRQASGSGLRRLAGLGLAAALAAAAGPAPACGLELVLALDVSRSVIDAEFDLQTQGLAAAFRDPQVVDAIHWTQGGIMVSVTQWSGPSAQTQTVPWTHLTDAASAEAFAIALAAQEREFVAAYTAIGEALLHAARVGEANPLPCARRVIDISGDGVANRGRSPEPIAEALAAGGITVNALVIRGASPDPEPFYRQHVVRGPGAFLVAANGFRDYARAIREKLLRELKPQMARR